jgi:ligand-binding sensor domain-containing protein
LLRPDFIGTRNDNVKFFGAFAMVNDTRPLISKIMHKKICLVFIFSVFLLRLGFAGIGDWTTYTNKNNIREVLLKDGMLWCATTGGAVVLDTQDGNVTQLTNVDGLGGNYLYAVALDSSGNLWLGAQNGTLSKHDLKGNNWDIYYNFTSGGRTLSIREIAADGEKLWVGSDVGVSIFYPNKPPHGEVTETYRRLGDSNVVTVVNSIHLAGDKIWVGTEKGVAFAPRDYRKFNLMDPKNWTSFVKESSPGLADDYVYTITDMEGEILIGTKKGVFKFDSVDSSWHSFGLGVENRMVRDLKYLNQKLLACTDWGLFTYENGSWIRRPDTGLLTADFNSVETDDSGFLWVGTAGKGISCYADDQWKNYVIGGPPGNVFLDMDIDAEGKLWCANDVAGVSYFDGSQWLSLDSVPEIDGHAMVAVEKDKEDNLWFSSWGGGVMKMGWKDTTWQRYTEKNSPLKGIAVDHAYVVVNDIAVDEVGNRWLPNWEAWDTTRVLCVPAYKDTFLVYYDGGEIISILMLKVKAMGGHLYICFRDLGLLDYNYNWTVEDKTDDQVIHYTIENHLSANTIMNVNVDKNGTLWVGTSAGLDTLDSEWGRFRTVVLPDPLGPQVNTIAVDERNNKWVGTSNGLGVINGQGEFIHVFTTFNSKICDNTINGIKIDKNTGDVWIGTANGLSRYESGIAPAKNLTEVVPYPNPFVITEGTEKLTFDRLPYQAKIKIYTVAGELVREINAGDQWDGRNKGGELVSGGMYLFYISDVSGKKAVGKIAVIRE